MSKARVSKSNSLQKLSFLLAMQGRLHSSPRPFKAPEDPRKSCRSYAQDKDLKGADSRRVFGLKEWAVNVGALRQGDQTVAFTLEYHMRT